MGIEENKRAGGKGIVFNKETDVRRFVANVFPNNAMWIEQAPGSTFGVPDCFIILNGVVTFIELKLGSEMNGKLKFAVRPAQRRNALKFIENGAMVYWLIGVRGSRVAHYLPSTQEALAGVVPII